MQQDILINWSPQETRVAVVEHGAVQELQVERTLERGLVGNVYLGKVARVLPGMQSAFIDIGLERAAFLHVADVWQKPIEGEAPRHAPQVPIEKQVFEGQSLMVQVIKDPIGTKGARLSTQVSIAGRLQLYKGERPIFDLYNVDEELAKALGRRVDLKSGGYLIVDQTEALTTIDVNTGGYVGSRNFDDTIFKTNLEAAHAIARQLRLRNLGGIIILDFIDMQSDEHRAAVLEEFRKALARDRTRMTVNGFTALGLVEMTRKRTRESLAHVLCEPCPTCGGRGEVKTPHTVCYEILREIVREARTFNAREFRVLASQAVIDVLLEDESASLAMLSEFIGNPVSMQVEQSYTQEQFDIVLM